MIAVDTSTLSAFLANEPEEDVQRLAEALQSGALVFPPVVITEIPNEALQRNLPEIQILDILDDGYWRRAGETRQVLKAKGLRAKIADTLHALRSQAGFTDAVIAKPSSQFPAQPGGDG